MNYQSTKKVKSDFTFFFIFNDLPVIENGGTSMCRGTSELIRGSLRDKPLSQAVIPECCCRESMGLGGGFRPRQNHSGVTETCRNDVLFGISRLN
jgi:hypothetical protein